MITDKKAKILPNGVRVFIAREVAIMMGVSQSLFRKWVLSGRFPKPETFGKSDENGEISSATITGWREGTILVWKREMEKRSNERR